ncbi:hypothetical protein VUR80DRAFT_3309 [Thermomyces stellatus]
MHLPMGHEVIVPHRAYKTPALPHQQTPPRRAQSITFPCIHHATGPSQSKHVQANSEALPSRSSSIASSHVNQKQGGAKSRYAADKRAVPHNQLSGAIEGAGTPRGLCVLRSNVKAGPLLFDLPVDLPLRQTAQREYRPLANGLCFFHEQGVTHHLRSPRICWLSSVPLSQHRRVEYPSEYRKPVAIRVLKGRPSQL